MDNKREVLFWIFLILLVFLRIFLNRPLYFDGDRIRITSRVLSEPVRYTKTQYFKLSGLKIHLAIYPEVNYGDTIIIEGRVNSRTKTLENPLLIRLVKSDSLLAGIRSDLLKFYQQSLPEPHAALVAGVAIGSKAQIPAVFWQQLKNSGTAHVVVASGMNVSLIAGFLLSVLWLFIPRKLAVIGACLGIWLYALIVGLEAPIVRAAGMGTVAFLAVVFGRLSLALRSLFLTAVVMLIIHPAWYADVGFWLSLAATGSLLTLEKRISRFFRWLPGLFREGLTTSLAAQVGVLPILYFTFGYINPLSPLINALILWTIPLITILGLIAGVLGLVIEPLGRCLLWLAYPLTSWFVWVVQIFN